MAEGFRRMYSQLRTIPIDDVVGTSTNAGNVLMSAPKLTIKAEPFEGSALVYGTLAARTTNDPPAGQLSLVLMITNNELMPVHLNQVAISFVGPPAASPSSIAADVIIGALQTTQWHFETNNNIILPVPAPGAVHIALSCDGFTERGLRDGRLRRARAQGHQRAHDEEPSSHLPSNRVAAAQGSAVRIRLTTPDFGTNCANCDAGHATYGPVQCVSS
jgi:hypothetical protein